MYLYRFSLPSLALSLSAAVLCGHAAAQPLARSELQARYLQEMAVCDSGQSNQDSEVCRREAQAVLAQARKGGLDEDQDDYEANALHRCDALTTSERGDCEARMNGKGTVSGSVAGGGLLREAVRPVPAE